MSDPFARLRELCRDLPDDLIADWRGTNHFELHSPGDAECYWWACLDDPSEEELREDTTAGQRAGLLLDIAAECSRLRKEGHL